jgi:inhibitor of cysteine peptidase
MEKFVSFILLLLAAALLAPGCMAEEAAVVDNANVMNVAGTAQSAGVLNEPKNATSPGEVSILDPVKTEVANATEVNVPVTKAPLTADVNTTNLTANLNDTILISLKENPTTGYSWNVTNSTGLEILSDEYVMDKAGEKMVGVGGVHTWTVEAVETGNQTFSAVMQHVADKPTGDEETYTLDVVVVMGTTEKTVNVTSTENPVAKNSVI